MRQFERFFGAITRFTVSAFTSDVSIFLLKLNDVSNKQGLNVLSCSKKQVLRYSGFSTKNNLMRSPTKNTINTMVQSSSIEDVNNSLEVFPSLTSFDGNTFALENQPLDLCHSINTTQTLLRPASSIASATRTVLTLLSLYNIKRNQ